MEGLDVTVLRLSSVLEDNQKFRIDDGYFARLPVQMQRRIEAIPHVKFGDISSVFRKGIFDIRADSYVEEGIPFVRISNLRQGLLAKSDMAFITREAHENWSSTGLRYGDIVLSKTAYPAASFVNLPECNVSQDIIAVQLLAPGQHRMASTYVVAYLNSRYGLALMGRQFQGNIQAHLSLPDGQKILIPLASETFQAAIANTMRTADEALTTSEVKLNEAEAILTAALGLADWQPAEPLTYTRSAKEAFAAGRWDAEYYHPAKKAFLEKLNSLPGMPLRDHYRTIREIFDPTTASPDEVVRSFDLTDALQPVLDDEQPVVVAAELGSLKKRFLNGDVVISRLRSYLREIALVRTAGSVPMVGSSEFIVLRPNVPYPTLTRSALIFFLRSQPVQTILQWSQDGSHHPRFGDDALMSIPVPDLVCSMAPILDDLLRDILANRRRAHALLEQAKRAVEIAIEQSEEAALTFLADAPAAP